MKRQSAQSSISLWVTAKPKNAQENSSVDRDLICWNVAGDGPSQIQIMRLSSLSNSNSVTRQRTPTQWTPVLSEEESRRGWCQFFVREKAKLLEGTWDVKLVPANHSVVALHAHQQHTPPIASVCGMKYREGIIADYEKACMSRGSCQNKPCGLDIQVGNLPLSVQQVIEGLL